MSDIKKTEGDEYFLSSSRIYLVGKDQTPTYFYPRSPKQFESCGLEEKPVSRWVYVAVGVCVGLFIGIWL